MGTVNCEKAKATRCPLSVTDKPTFAECKSMQNQSKSPGQDNGGNDAKILIRVTKSLFREQRRRWCSKTTKHIKITVCVCTSVKEQMQKKSSGPMKQKLNSGLNDHMFVAKRGRLASLRTPSQWWHPAACFGSCFTAGLAHFKKKDGIMRKASYVDIWHKALTSIPVQSTREAGARNEKVCVSKQTCSGGRRGPKMLWKATQTLTVKMPLAKVYVKPCKPHNEDTTPKQDKQTADEVNNTHRYRNHRQTFSRQLYVRLWWNTLNSWAFKLDFLIMTVINPTESGGRKQRQRKNRDEMKSSPRERRRQNMLTR